MADLGGLGGLGVYGGYLGAEDASATARAKKYAVDQAQQGDIAFGRTLQLLSGGQGQGMPQQGMPPGPPGMPPQGAPPGMPQPPVGSPPMGAPGGQPQLPPRPPIMLGAQPQGGAMPPMGQQPMPPMGPVGQQPPMPGAGGAPPMPGGQPGMQQPPQPPQGLPQQGGPGLDWRMVLQKTIQANPGAPPQVLAAAVDRWLPLMNQQSQQQWKEQSLMLRERAEFDREQTARDRERLASENLDLKRAQYGLPPLGGGGGAGGGQGGEQPKTGAQEIGDAIISGNQPPTLTGLYRQGAAVRTYLAQQGFNLAQAQQEWSRAQKLVLSLNGPQMVKFEALANSVNNTIDEVNNLAERMELSGIPALNSVELAKYIQTEGNSPNGTLATDYVTAVGTLKEEFANLAAGGYAPTEPAWALANKQINENYGVKQLGSSLNEIKRLITYRVQAINNMGGTAGPGSPNRYTGQTGAVTQPPAATDTTPGGQVRGRFQYDQNGNPVGQ